MNKKGKMQIYCAHCGKYQRMDDEQFNWVCPSCGNLFTTMKCTRCGYKWDLRNRKLLTKICANPKCHSPYWCRERVRDRRTGKYIPVDKRV